jgi:hypothetical protein
MQKLWWFSQYYCAITGKNHDPHLEYLVLRSINPHGGEHVVSSAYSLKLWRWVARLPTYLGRVLRGGNWPIA